MIRALLDGVCPAIGRDIEGKKAKASQGEPKSAAEGPAAARPLKNTSTQVSSQSQWLLSASTTVPHSSQIQLAITNKRKGFSGLS